MISLASEHWKETEMYRHGQEFKPIFERYNQYAKLGWLFHFVARDEGKMVGYSLIYLTPSMHTQKSIATEDTFFLSPSHRKGRNGIRFYRYIEQEMFKKGAFEVVFTAKMTNSVGKILEYLDFQRVAVQYSKQLVRADSTHD